MIQQQFWKTTSLSELNQEEWEQLCDGCGRCCVKKFLDEDTGELFYTEIACRLLDIESCRCIDYKHRKQQVPECAILSTEDSEPFLYLPETCAYRLIAQNRELPPWHPLLTNNPESVHAIGISVKGKVISEEHVPPDEWENFILDEHE